MDESTDDRIFVSVIPEGLAHGEVGRDNPLSARHHGGKGRAKDFRMLRAFEDCFFRSLGFGGPTCNCAICGGEENHRANLGKLAFDQPALCIQSHAWIAVATEEVADSAKGGIYDPEGGFELVFMGSIAVFVSGFG